MTEIGDLELAVPPSHVRPTERTLCGNSGVSHLAPLEPDSRQPPSTFVEPTPSTLLLLEALDARVRLLLLKATYNTQPGVRGVKALGAPEVETLSRNVTQRAYHWNHFAGTVAYTGLYQNKRSLRRIYLHLVRYQSNLYSVAS